MPDNDPDPIAPAPSLDLAACDREPIHIPGSIQPHGVLLVLAEPGLEVEQASANAAESFGFEGEPLGAALEDLLGEQPATRIRAALQALAPGRDPEHVGVAVIGGRQFNVVAHRYHHVIVEFETIGEATSISFQGLHRLVRTFVSGLEGASSARSAAHFTADQVRRLTGFDRVLVYQFDESWHGHVIAENRDPEVDSYLDRWFPASDIPAQARELYRLNRLRLIVNSRYQAVPIRSAGPKEPLDLSYSTLRSVSPIHLEYLRNMDAAASMSISVLRDGRLWGLIACHHRQPRLIPFEVRSACDLIGQFLSEHVAMKERAADYEQRIAIKSIQSRLLAYMAQQPVFAEGLVNHPDELLSFVSADGAAVIYEDRCDLIGSTPPEAEVRRLAGWLIEQGREGVFCSENLASVLPDGEAFRLTASGVLAISISQLFGSYVLWFRPEVVQTVRWAGDPTKPVHPPTATENTLSPRRSFKEWKQLVRGHSLPWTAAEIDGATELRSSILGIVLRKAEELATLSDELQRSNRELESFSYSVSHDLRAPFRHIVGYAELLKDSTTAQLSADDRRYLDVIVESAYFAGDLVDNLLNYSRIGRLTLRFHPVDMNVLVREVIRENDREVIDRRIQWEVGDLPPVYGDVTLLRVVWQNLLGNAIKYTRGRNEDARIQISGQKGVKESVFSVRDNGVGFDPQYAGKLFGVFQRLHRVEEFEGTGIGLANVRRIVGRHGGRTWAESELGKGAQFYFSVPNRAREEA